MAERWTDERVERLRALVEDEALSAAQLAERMGVTRNALIGKCRRLGLVLPLAVGIPDGYVHSAVKPKPSPKRRAKASRKPIEPPDGVLPISAPPAADLASRSGAYAAVMHLEKGHCKWPSGDPQADDFHFCCEPVRADGENYCVAHHAVYAASVAASKMWEKRSFTRPLARK